MWKPLFTLFIFFLFFNIHNIKAQNRTLRSYGVSIGVLPTGENNAITDVSGVLVGHKTLIEGSSVRTGVTAIIPHSDNIFQYKVPAAIYIGNGFGKLAGYSQVEELGNLETPIVLTNTLNVATGINALVQYTLGLAGNEDVRSVNAVVGETNDGYLNDIRGQHVKEEDVFTALEQAASGPVAQGNVGAGTGTRCFAYKGGIGTSSRVVSKKNGGYTVGVLVQANFGGILHIKGLPIEQLMNKTKKEPAQKDTDGSCMMVVATDAPLDSRNLKRLAKRAMLGLARTGGIASNGSGDYVIAFSTAESLRIPYKTDSDLLDMEVLSNDNISSLFLATIEATEEAIYNALFTAETLSGHLGEVNALPEEKVIQLIDEHGLLK
ncbi:D-aminopeptidase [Catalinimonas alkaloidigena]|uniref:P1 family peptidase n=1 Tax=Catalinimonas alkaloidigena TaxID=1075417 RepID=UPI0024066FBB|nr:P1 family peptidase [Catalinimonas alkaloidigena]MDF9795902.1 D-aminopeptidase [Catalinimonas alkaloidigena]